MSMLPCRPTLPTPRFSPLPTPSTSMRPMLNVGRRVVSHQHLKDAKTLVEPGLQSSNQRQSLPQKIGRLDKNAFLGRRPVLNRTHTSRQRLEDATEPLLASMRPA